MNLIFFFLLNAVFAKNENLTPKLWTIFRKSLIKAAFFTLCPCHSHSNKAQSVLVLQAKKICEVFAWSGSHMECCLEIPTSKGQKILT